MAREQAFTNLRDVLADIYLDDADALRVASDAQIKLGRLVLEGSAVNRWQAILREAENTGRVEALFDVVLGEYDTNADLRAAIDAYRQAAPTERPKPPRADSAQRGDTTRPTLPRFGIATAAVLVLLILIAVALVEYFSFNQVPSTPEVSATSTSTSTPTTAPTFTAEAQAPAQTPTAVPTPDFISLYVYDADWNIEQVEFDFEAGIVPTETITDFVRLDRLAFGEFGDGAKGFDVHLVVTNTSARPLLLTLDPRFFSFDDDQGRKAQLLYFCCAAQGEFLAPGQERTVQLLFQAVPGWEGKLLVANSLFFRVRGLLPIVRAGWRVPALATGE